MRRETYRSALFCLIFICFSVYAFQKQELFSPFNRYSLSLESIQVIRDTVDSASSIWFSVPEIRFPAASTVVFSTENQSINADIGTMFGYEYYKENNRFGLLTGGITYSSKYLKAVISADVYSTERRITSEMQDIQYERFIKEDFNQPIEGMFDFRFNLPEAYLETNLKFLTLSIGKQKMRWGPGYKGTLGLSGTAYSPFYYYNLNLRFGKLFRMAAFLCGYDDESVYTPELNITDTIRVKNNEVNLRTYLPRYGAGQRLDIRFGKHVQVGFYELVSFFGTNELTRFANPLQIYYLANEASGTNNANLLGGMDINIIINRFRMYGEFLNDDITVFDNDGNPNKYAYQVGAIYYGKDKLVQTGIEYTHVARYVYSHSRVLSRHAHWGESMGWPWGNDQDLFTAHAVFAFPHNIHGKLELNYWIKGEGELEDDWYADGRPNLDRAPYWPERATKRFSGMIGAEYKPVRWAHVALFYEPIWVKERFENAFYSYLKMSVPGKYHIRAD